MMLPPKSKPQVRTAELVLSRASCFPRDRQSLGYPLPTAITGRTLNLPIVMSYCFSCSSNSNPPPSSSSLLYFGSSFNFFPTVPPQTLYLCGTAHRGLQDVFLPVRLCSSRAKTYSDFSVSPVPSTDLAQNWVPSKYLLNGAA